MLFKKLISVCAAWLLIISSTLAADAQPLTIVVMDPLAKELSCPCVAGYAQRNYQLLGKHLEQTLKRPVKVVFSESLVKATSDLTNGAADLVIGKKSVVEFDATRLQRQFQPIASLTGKDGLTTQTGLIVVAKDNPAKSVSDLKGQLIVFGPTESAEKHAAAIALLNKHDVTLPGKLETADGCDTGATRILELPAGQLGAAVISSYAKPLLEGCGTVPKGALRVVGTTEPVAFVTAFVSDKLTSDEQTQISDVLTMIKTDTALCKALETSDGFLPIAKPEPAAATNDVKKKD
jgi:ABC-type phosphate/phosphonate transport system substrate-binding protein